MKTFVSVIKKSYKNDSMSYIMYFLSFLGLISLLIVGSFKNISGLEAIGFIIFICLSNILTQIHLLRDDIQNLKDKDN